MRVTWKRENYLRYFRRKSSCTVGDVAQHRLSNHRYRSTRKGTAAREPAREHLARLVIGGYNLSFAHPILTVSSQKTFIEGRVLLVQGADSL